MDSGAKKMLETVTLETLHAHNFSRSSSQAHQVLTDLLARYLTVLSASCAKYAEHAGRLRLSVRDAVCALDEMGVGMEELSEYAQTEGREMARYAVHTARRVEDLAEFKAALAVGLREDRDDVIPLVYERVPTSFEGDEGEESASEEEASDESAESETKAEDLSIEKDEETADAEGGLKPEQEQTLGKRREATPTLPLSPISNPSTPARKRPRTASWRPPPHIPDFLPPFPTDTPRHTPSPPPQDATQPAHPVKLERPPSPLPQAQIASSASSADYLTQVPYTLSSLASSPSWHLPSAPPLSPGPSVPPKGPIPQVQPALLGAYHHVLTHPPPPTVNSVNPARYKVALAFIAQSEASSRWDPAATLFSTTAPNPPRVPVMGPTYPVAAPEKGGEEGKRILPLTAPKPVIASERVTSLISQQVSRLPQVARQVLPHSVYNRTAKLTHPPVLMRGTQKLTYGPGAPAPWNANVPVQGATSQGPNGTTNGKDSESKPLPDAKLYATWNYEQKRYQDPTLHRRGRMGTISMAPPTGPGSESRRLG